MENAWKMKIELGLCVHVFWVFIRDEKKDTTKEH